MTDAAALAPVLRRQVAVVAVCPTADVTGRAELITWGADCAFQVLCPDEALYLLLTLLRTAPASTAERRGLEVIRVGRLTADCHARAAAVDATPVRLTELEFNLLW